ncbi:hypothetical protein F4810DRAFT_692585 [Camillea tinctor]|nr:hypothetical protein F4810DRAFT_692585 [Camillea tinctor]
MGPESENDVSRPSLQASSVSSPEGAEFKTSNRSKANIRVSLACVQCRSKHVKCDATLPACNRCQADKKPCFYAKSRRGIRDPKKRSLISDKPPVSPSKPLFSTSSIPSPSTPDHRPNNLPGGWSINSNSQELSSHANEREALFDAFYNYFHPSHPCLLPKRLFLDQIESDPNSYHFLLSVIEFCGSLYLPHVCSEGLREAAYSAACGSLPFTVQSVQGLILLSAVAFGEAKFEHHAGFVFTAIQMAVELGMHLKTFADPIINSVLAESYRRTWWCLVLQDSLRTTEGRGPALSTRDVECDVDLPCEEWEYNTENIPHPISQFEYETHANLGRTDFSSMALLIDICRIQTELVAPYSNLEPEDKKTEMFQRADSRICDWLRRVPRWKMDLVDPEGKVDIVLFHALALAHINRLRLRQDKSRQGINLSQYFLLGPPTGPDRKGQAVKHFGWSPHPIDIQAANGLCDLFRYPLPPINLCPAIGFGVLRAALAYLDACAFLSLDSAEFREKINMITQVFTVHGKAWPLSKRAAEEINLVVKEHLASARQHSSHSESSESESWVPIQDSLLNRDLYLGTDFAFDPNQDYSFIQQWTVNGTWPNFVNVYPV